MHLLPMNVVMTLASYPSPSKEPNEDQLFWNLSMNGEFTIKLVYLPFINSCYNRPFEAFMASCLEMERS